jgi:hypothetical protein
MTDRPSESTPVVVRQCGHCGREERNPEAQRCTCGRWLPGNNAGRPFPAGHELRRVHGARSGRALAERTASALEELEAALDGGPGSEPRYARARQLAAAAIARVLLLEEWLDVVGVLDGKGRIRPAVKALEAAHGAAQRWLVELGMTPRAAAGLGVDLSRAKANLAAELAAERRKRDG